DGCLYRLFNATRPVDHFLNRLGVPDDFTMLNINNDLHRHTEEQYLQPGPVCTTSTTWTKVDMGASGSAPQVGVDLSYKFSCVGDREAITVLRNNAMFVAGPVEIASASITRPGRHLCESRGWHIHGSELMLVYGCVKTSAWALAVYVVHSTEHDISLSMSAGSFASVHADAKSHEEVKMSMEEWGEQERSISAPKDQCLFLSYYKLKRRRIGALKLQGDATLKDVSIALDS
ncbi:uncharacterized protein PHACADRAFT_98445, partial [Phanerochaete carnosa HHB-10118-sp]